MDNLVRLIRRGKYPDIDHYDLGGWWVGEHWWLCGSNTDWHAAVKAAKGSKMEGVFLPEFGDVGREWPRDVCSDELVAFADGRVHAKLLLDSGERGVSPQAGCNLSAVLDCKQMQVAVALLEHEVVCLPDLFLGGSEGEPSIDKARLGEGGVGAVSVAVFFSLGVLDMGGYGSTPGGVVGHHDEWIFSV